MPPGGGVHSIGIGDRLVGTGDRHRRNTHRKRPAPPSRIAPPGTVRRVSSSAASSASSGLAPGPLVAGSQPTLRSTRRGWRGTAPLRTPEDPHSGGVCERGRRPTSLCSGAPDLPASGPRGASGAHAARRWGSEGARPPASLCRGRTECGPKVCWLRPVTGHEPAPGQGWCRPWLRPPSRAPQCDARPNTHQHD